MTEELPGDKLDMEKMPGHWALAQIGKRVLRPGGLELTRLMLQSLAIGPEDHVVEFAPGLGITAKMAVGKNPASYTAIERDQVAATKVAGYLSGSHQRCVVGTAKRTGLESGCATVVYGEAMLTMQPSESKWEIIAEAARLLKPGGRYAIHEICLIPEDIPTSAIKELEHDLGQAIRSGVRPLRKSEWHEILAAAGLSVEVEFTNDFRLLEPRRVLQDEGIRGALRIGWNMIRNSAARSRVLSMRRAIGKHADHMRAILIVAVKTST